ncbi:MAG: hypothetical protein ACRDJH_20370, partial [Thermomicrobiales bacterium]
GAAGAAGAAALAGQGMSSAAARQASPVAEGDVIRSGVEGVPDAYFQQPEPFQSYDGVPGNGGTVRVFTIAYNPPPPGRDDNQYWQELERRLGVTWEPQITPQPNYGEISAVLIAGGDLPDLFYLNPGQSAQQQYQAMAQGAFLDLTPYVTGDALAAYGNLSTIPQFMWDNVKFQGKIFGVPKPLWRNGNLPFYRGDWASTLGMTSLEDPEQVRQLLLGFTNNDPDGNGQADTWGMGRFSSGWNSWDNILAIYMFGVPKDWQLNADGTLTHAIETEGYRQALDFLRQLYADGGYHPDAAAMTFSDAQGGYIAGETGVHFEGFLSFYGIGNVTYRGQEINPAFLSTPLIPRGPGGVPGVTHNETGFFGFTGIPSSITDEDRIQELLRILDYLAAPFGSEESIFLGSGIEGVHHDINEAGARIINDLGRTERGDLVYVMGGLPVYYYPDNPPIAEEIQRVAIAAVAIGVDNPAQVLYSETNVEMGPQLVQLGGDRTLAIVTGREPLEALDDAIQEWRDRGGDQIREDFQQALQEQG